MKKLFFDDLLYNSANFGLKSRHNDVKSNETSLNYCNKFCMNFLNGILYEFLYEFLYKCF